MRPLFNPKPVFTMQTKSAILRSVQALLAAAALALLSGCATPSLTNITPVDIPDNPSNIYTIVARVIPTVTNAVPDSATAKIVIDGQTFDMKKSAAGNGLFEFDYHLPIARDSVTYYFVGIYKVKTKGVESERVEYSPLQTSSILGRYVSTMDAYRGFVGAKISVLGKGFNNNDVVYINGTAAKTTVESAGSISFYVPALEPAANYAIEISDGQSKIPAGAFRVDNSSVSVSPSPIYIRQGDTTIVTFAIPAPAGFGGVYLDVTTDIPQSVIMSEVVIPAGRTNVQAYLSGGKPGAGNIYLKGYGGGEVKVPVIVQ
jgi:hypothetical protein